MKFMRGVLNITCLVHTYITGPIVTKLYYVGEWVLLAQVSQCMVQREERLFLFNFCLITV